MLIEMNAKVEYHTDVPSEIWQFKKALDTEFGPEIAAWDGRPTEAMQLDSVYTQVMDIAGTPVNNSYHFGQSLINNYGRPYWQGVNNIHGLQRQRQRWPLRFLYQWRIPILAHHARAIRCRCGR